MRVSGLRSVKCLSGARKAFDASKTADSHFTEADLALAELDLREGHNGPVRQRLGPIVTANPKNTTALLLLASAEHELGESVAMIAHYRAVLDTDSANVVALNNLAYVFATTNPDEALKLAQQAVEIAPDR